MMLDFREKPEDAVLTVSQLTRRIKNLLEGNLPPLTVSGEISGFRPAASGHYYFDLKDANSKIPAVMWRSTVTKLPFRPQDGDQVVAKGEITVYEPSGRYQMVVNSLRPAGAGDARAALEALINKLRGEGLLDPAHKKEIPAFPRCIGLVTSPTGAAVRDMIKVIHKRLPCAKMVLSPCKVQGADAPADIVRALERLDRSGLCEVIIIGRGGGSQEDLSAFNDEQLARAVYACKTPVISSVGHEIDTSVCDLVADLRAATPSEAAEFATPDRRQVLGNLQYLQEQLDAAINARTMESRQQIIDLQRIIKRSHPVNIWRQQQQRADEAAKNLHRALREILTRARNDAAILDTRLQAISPLAVLNRGYSITRNSAGRVVRRAAEVSRGETLQITVSQGTIAATAN